MPQNATQPRRPSTGKEKPGPAWRLLAVGLLAFALRAGYTAQFSRGPGELIGDARQYHGFAMNIAQKGEYVDAVGDRLFRMPGYPVFMAGVYRVFGPSVLAVQLVQCFLGALACVGLFAAARRLYGERFGLGAGLAAAVYFGMIDPCVLILSESLATSLLAGFFWAWFCLKTPLLRVAAGAFLLALACLARPDFLPFAGAACLLLTRIERGFKVRHSLLWFGVFLLMWSPWLMRNYRTFHKFIPGSTQGPAGLYMGLALPLTRLGDIEKTNYVPHQVDEMEQNKIYRRELAKLLKEVPPAKILRAYALNITSVFYPFLPEYDWTYMVLLPFWLWSAMLLRAWPCGPNGHPDGAEDCPPAGARSRGPNGFSAGGLSDARLLWLLIATYCLVHVFAGGPVSRYRQPIAGALILLAVGGAQDLERRFGPRLWRWTGVYAGGNIAVWLFAPQFRSVALKLRALVF